MAGLTVPVVTDFPAGYVVQQADLQNLSNACTFLLQKPFTKVVDTAGGVSIFGTLVAITFSLAQFDVDGMWNSGAPHNLTVQTPGWYKVRYGVSCTVSVNNTYNASARSVTGSNNPVGSGVVTYAWGASSGGASVTSSCVACAAGLWPQYLWAGDSIQLVAQATSVAGTTATTTASMPGGANNGGSYLSLEYVSTQ